MKNIKIDSFEFSFTYNNIHYVVDVDGVYYGHDLDFVLGDEFGACIRVTNHGRFVEYLQFDWDETRPPLPMFDADDEPNAEAVARAMFDESPSDITHTILYNTRTLILTVCDWIDNNTGYNSMDMDEDTILDITHSLRRRIQETVILATAGK